MGDVIMWIALVGMAICFWGLFQNHKTGEERKLLVEAAFRNPDNWRELARELDEISYDRHMVERMLLRDPFKLYSLRLQAAYGSLLAN